MSGGNQKRSPSRTTGSRGSSSQEMDDRKAREVLLEAARRAQRRENMQFQNLLFDKQLAFVNDPSKTKAAVCSRRAGKSYAITVMALQTALKMPNVMIPIITLTRQQAKKIVWPVFIELNKKHNLGLKFLRNELIVECPNASTIFLCGANDESEIERLRGPKYPLVIIDEAQSFRPYLARMIEDIIEPAILDYDGTICLTGTPNATCTGFFHDVTLPGSSWSTHSWTLLENPFIPNAADWLQKRRAKYNWDDQHPTYLREYRGVWVKDTDALVYKRFSTVDGFDPSDDDWAYVLGVDLGYTHSSAFVVCGYNEGLNKLVVVESFKKSGLIPSEVAEIMQSLEDEYQFDTIVADVGGIGKGYVEEAKARFGINIKEAEKSKKRAYIELLNGDFQTNTVVIDAETNQDLIDEMNVLQWDEKRLRPDDTRYDDHLCDALLYAWRYCYQYLYTPEEATVEFGSREYWSQVEDKMEEEQEQLLDKASTRLWWEPEETAGEGEEWWNRDAENLG